MDSNDDPEDILLIGSVHVTIIEYENSDLDLHIIVDFVAKLDNE